ncbi:MAG: hypothetical protein H0U73_01700 [Tatlockia sp.]|nr:hypothetical protein [Tatlockia sp.]
MNERHELNNSDENEKNTKKMPRDEDLLIDNRQVKKSRFDKMSLNNLENDDLILPIHLNEFDDPDNFPSEKNREKEPIKKEKDYTFFVTNLVKNLIHQGDSIETILESLAESLTEIDFDAAAILKKIGFGFLSEEKNQEAEKCFGAVVNLTNSSDLLPSVMLVKAQLEQNKLVEQDFEQCLKLIKSNFLSGKTTEEVHDLGCMLYDREKYKEAELCFRHNLTAATQVDLGDAISMQLNFERIDEAAQCYLRAYQAALKKEDLELICSVLDSLEDHFFRCYQPSQLYILNGLFSESHLEDHFNKFYFVSSRLIKEKSTQPIVINFIKETCKYLNAHILSNDEADSWKPFFKKGNNAERFFQLYKKLVPVLSFVNNYNPQESYQNFMPQNAINNYAFYPPQLYSYFAGFQQLPQVLPPNSGGQNNPQTLLQINRNYPQQGFFAVIQHQERTQQIFHVTENTMS